MSSNVREMRDQVAALKVEMASLTKEVTVARSLLMDVTGLMALAGIKDAREIRRYIILLYQLKAAYDAVQLARMAAGDPLAWISAGITVTTAAVHTVDLAGCYG